MLTYTPLWFLITWIVLASLVATAIAVLVVHETQVWHRNRLRRRATGGKAPLELPKEPHLRLVQGGVRGWR